MSSSTSTSAIDAINTAVNTTTNAIDTIVDTTTNAIGDVANVTANAIDNVADATANAIDTVVDATANAIETIVEPYIALHKYPLQITRIPVSQLRHRPFNMLAKATLPPTSVDLRSYFCPVFDQGTLGSCTANSLSALCAYATANAIIGSRLFIYYNERVIENSVGQDAGALISDGVKSVETTGVCLETDWPYDISKFTERPPEICYENAAKNNGFKFMNIVSDSLSEMKSALAAGYPFSLGVAIYQSFESSAVATSGMVPMPNTRHEQMLGGHAMAVVGYDDSKSCFLVRNSWGAGWGIGGHCWMPYAYLTNPTLTSDMWALQTLPATFKTPPPVVSDKPVKCANHSCVIA